MPGVPESQVHGPFQSNLIKGQTREISIFRYSAFPGIPSGGPALAGRALGSEAPSWARKAHADAQLSLLRISTAGGSPDEPGLRLSLGKLNPLSAGVVVCVHTLSFPPAAISDPLTNMQVQMLLSKEGSWNEHVSNRLSI